MGAGPDSTGTSPQGNESYIYNPSGDYTNYFEMQFRDDKVVEMSTISAYFRYADLVSSGDSADTLTGNGFASTKPDTVMKREVRLSMPLWIIRAAVAYMVSRFLIRA